MLLVVLSVMGTGCSRGDARQAEEAAGRGLALAKAGRSEDALKEFRRALELDRSSVKARFNAGLALLQLRRPGEAQAELAEFLKLRPEDLFGHFHLARALVAQGRSAEALVSLQKSVDLGFSNYMALAGTGDFQPLYSNVQYLALEMAVAQRAGVRPRGGALGVDSPTRIGGQPLPHLKLPTANAAGKQCGGDAVVTPPFVPPQSTAAAQESTVISLGDLVKPGKAKRSSSLKSEPIAAPRKPSVSK